MGNLKQMKGIVLTGVMLLIFSYTQLRAQSYGSENYTTFDIEDNGNYKSFAMLDSVVNNYNVFFVGENHTFRTSNYKLQLKMLKYLYQKVGVRNLLLEFGHSRGWLVNEYVQTGDTNLLNVLDDYSYEEYTELYKALREFNKTLPAGKKIRVMGIDIERAYSTSVKVLSMQLPDQHPPAEISLHIEAINGLATYNDEYYNKERDEDEKSYKSSSSSYYKYSSAATVETILANFKEQEAIYKSYLGDKFELFKKIISGLEAGEERSDYKTDRAMQAHIFREQYMYKEFMRIVEENPGEKFFSQFGRCHTPRTEQDSWCNFYAFKSLASRINDAENPHIKNKVMSIASYYPQSALYEKRMVDHVSIAPMIDLANSEGLTLFRISRDTAIFDEFADKFQFLIVNNNSLKGESTTSTTSSTSSIYDYSRIYGHLDGTYGFLQLDFSNLDASFQAMGLSTPESQVSTFGGGMIYIDFTGVAGGFRFNIYESTIYQLFDTTEISFGGNSFGIFSGGDIFYGNKWVSLIPAIGYGFAQLKIKVTEEGVSTQQGFFIESSTTETVYRNPAFYFDFSLDARFTIKLISFGIKGGYQLDVSKKQWRTDGQLLMSSPKTSLSGFWAAASVSLYFAD